MSHSARRPSATHAPPSRKRRRSSGSPELGTDIPEVDLVSDNPADILRQKELKDQVQQQQKAEARSQPLGARSCIICMDDFVNMTVTVCGHVFCHECLDQALHAGDRTTCPVCRKNLKKTTKSNIFPLSLMTKKHFEANKTMQSAQQGGPAAFSGRLQQQS